MASKWVEFRDEVTKSLDFKTIDERAKQEFTAWLLATGIPLAEKAADNFTAQVKAQATDEQGWCKLRDLIVLPFIVNGVLWLVQTSLSKTVDTTK